MAFAVVLGLAQPARADWKQEFLGWSYDGTSYCGQASNGCMANGPFLCATAADQFESCPSSTPPLRARCVDIAWHDPAGIAITVENKTIPSPTKDAPAQVNAIVTVRAGVATATGVLENAPKASTDRHWFSPTAQWVAVEVAFAQKASCGDDDTRPAYSIVMIDVSALKLQPAKADRDAARKANADGMAALLKGRADAAAGAFHTAIAADSSFVLPHYNLASIASIVGDVPVVRRELAWLAASRDQGARTALDRAKTDPDLDFASVDPQVRKLIGAPAFPAVAKDRLVERRGVWSADGKSCGAPALTLTFAAAAKLQLSAITECKGKRDVKSAIGTWTSGPAPDDAAIVLDAPFAGLATSKLAWSPCDYAWAADFQDAKTDLGDSGPMGSCFTLAVGPKLEFHRGAPTPR
jgi:hypothetical protein